MSNYCVRQWIHSVVLWEKGSGIKVCWGLFSIPLLVQGTSSPDRNSWTRGSRAGRHSRSSSSCLASGLGQSDGSLVPSSSPQVSGWGSPALVSSLGSSLKVTCSLSHMGLGDWPHLLVGSLWCDATWGHWSDGSPVQGPALMAAQVPAAP